MLTYKFEDRPRRVKRKKIGVFSGVRMTYVADVPFELMQATARLAIELQQHRTAQGKRRRFSRGEYCTRALEYFNAVIAKQLGLPAPRYRYKEKMEENGAEMERRVQKEWEARHQQQRRPERRGGRRSKKFEGIT